MYLHKPQITTIIPTYRRPKLLRRAILSALNQTYPNVRVCVYDNASGDETADVVLTLAKKDSRVKYHCHKKNIGGPKNLQYGLKYIDAPFFSILMDDDVLLPDFYQKALKKFNDYPKAMFSAGLTICMDEKSRVICTGPRTWDDEYCIPPKGFFEMLGDKFPTWTGVLFRTEVLKHIGGVNMKLGDLADLDFELRIAASYPIVVSNKPHAIFLVHESSATATHTINSFLPNYLKMVDNLCKDKRLLFDDDTRIRLRNSLLSKVPNRVFRNAFGYMRRKNYDAVREVAEILDTRYNEKKKSIFLSTFAKIFECIPPAHYLFYHLIDTYRFFKRKRNQELQKKFGHYARYLFEA